MPTILWQFTLNKVTLKIWASFLETYKKVIRTSSQIGIKKKKHEISLVWEDMYLFSSILVLNVFYRIILLSSDSTMFLTHHQHLHKRYVMKN